MSPKVAHIGQTWGKGGKVQAIVQARRIEIMLPSLLTGPVEPLALGDVVDLAVDGDADAALVPRAVVLLQLDQRHVLFLEGRQRRRGRRQVGLCQEYNYSIH